MTDNSDAVEKVLAQAAALATTPEVELGFGPVWHGDHNREDIHEALDLLLSRGEHRSDIEFAMIQILLLALRERSRDVAEVKDSRNAD